MRKKLIIFIILIQLIASIFILPTPSFSQNLSNQQNNISNDIGWYTSVAVDSDNNPHISYYDYDNGDLKYAHYNGRFWVIHTVDSENDVGGYTSIALDSENNPHICYYDADFEDLKYAHYTGDSWKTTKVDEKGKVGLFNSITIDKNNTPHISYVDYDNHFLKYAYVQNDEWNIQQIDEHVGLGEYFGDTTSIAVDSSGNPHISYTDREHFDLKYAYYTGDSWKINRVDETGNVGQYSSLIIDVNDLPHISYASWSDFTLKYAHLQNENWNVQTVDDKGDVRKWTSIDLDSQNNPHISYYDYTLGSLEYIFSTGSNWEKESVDIQGSTGCFNTICLTINDDPVISYYDWGNKALKYATLTDESWTIEIVEIDEFHDFIDQQQVYCSGYSYPVDEGKLVAQSFTPLSEVVTMVELMIVKRNNPGTFTVSIRENIDGQDLTSISLSAHEIAEDLSWKTFDIEDINVTPGQTYYLVCSSTDTVGYDKYYWYFGHNEPYVDGKTWIYNGGWKIYDNPNFPGLDMGFKTFGRINITPNVAPNSPMINGPHSGKVDSEFSFEIYAIDVNNDSLYYKIQWRENDIESIGPSPTGERIVLNHTWSESGKYTISVKAIDEHGAESEWSHFQISVPKTKKIQLYTLINEFFEEHPQLLRILNCFFEIGR